MSYNSPHPTYTIPPSHYTKAFERLVSELPVNHEKKFVNNEKHFENLLEDLQANILTHHGKDFFKLYFIRFNQDKTSLENTLKWISQISTRITKAKDQFERIKQLKIKRSGATIKDEPVFSFYLTWNGYKALLLDHLAPPLKDNKAFVEGLNNRVSIAKNVEVDNDKGQIVDEKIYPSYALSENNNPDNNQEIHALLTIAGNSEDFSGYEEEIQIKIESKKIKNGITDTLLSGIIEDEESIKKSYPIAAVAIQRGIKKLREIRINDGTEDKIAVEWFGFRDGVSQPLFFPSFFEKNLDAVDTTRVAPLKIALTKDIGGKYWYSAGSFLAFLKLEQNIKQFRRNRTVIKSIITSPKGSSYQDALAEAYMLGRFYDGTSVALEEKPKLLKRDKATNDFQYSIGSDKKGNKCPFAAHARKANPRNANAVFIVRRGLPYDDELVPGANEKEFDKKKIRWELRDVNDDELPEKNKGLLFMSFQSDLEKQFEQILNNWISSVQTDTEPTGVDLIMGSRLDHQFSRWYLPKVWGDNSKSNFELLESADFEPCVTFKGGAYFFAPSISFLENASKNSLLFMLPDKENRRGMAAGMPRLNKKPIVPRLKPRAKQNKT